MPNANRIKHIMVDKGMTQADLARKSNIDKSHISHILKRNGSVLEPTLYRICKALDCKPEDIMLTGEENG